MLFEKKKPQQDDSEKLQALLKSWDIQFPETSEKDFPKADFPEKKSAPPKIQLEKTEQKQKAVVQKMPELGKEPEKEINLDKFFGESKHKKKEPVSLLTGNPDLDKLFKKQIIQYMHGTVRMITISNLMLSLSVFFIGVFWMHGITAFLSVFCFLGAFLWTWYQFSWKLTFNGETNRFSYKTLFHDEIQFHASEIQNCTIERKISKMMMDILTIKVYDRTIVVNLGYIFKNNTKTENYGGYSNALKLKEYIDTYQDLHGRFHYSGFLAVNEKNGSSSKEELMQMLAQYQKQIDEKKNLDKE